MASTTESESNSIISHKLTFDEFIKLFNKVHKLPESIEKASYSQVFSRFEFDFRTRALSYCNTVEDLYNLSNILMERQNVLLITCKTDKERFEALKQTNGILHFIMVQAKIITSPSAMSRDTVQMEIATRPTLIIPPTPAPNSLSKPNFPTN
jgi:hypothetical protein